MRLKLQHFVDLRTPTWWRIVQTIRFLQVSKQDFIKDAVELYAMALEARANQFLEEDVDFSKEVYAYQLKLKPESKGVLKDMGEKLLDLIKPGGA